MRLLVPLLLAVTAEGPGSARPGGGHHSTPSCDGTPPELVSQDEVPHAYTLTCGKRVTERSLPPAEKHVLEGFSGCSLTLGGQAETLHTEMVCTVQKGGKLTCDLL